MAGKSFRENPVIAEVYIDGIWVRKNFQDIERGEIFRTFKDYENKELNKDADGHWAFVAIRKAYSEDGFSYRIDCKPVTETENSIAETVERLFAMVVPGEESTRMTAKHSKYPLMK